MLKKLILLFVLLVPTFLFAANIAETKVITIANIDRNTVHVDSLLFVGKGLEGYFTTYLVAFRGGSDDTTFSGKDSVSLYYKSMDKAVITVNGTNIEWWTDGGDSTVVWRGSLIGREGIATPFTSITPVVCDGIKYYLKYYGDSGDSLKAYILTEIH